MLIMKRLEVTMDKNSLCCFLSELTIDPVLFYIFFIFFFIYQVEELRLQIISPSTIGSCPPSHKILEEKLLGEMKRNSELSSALKSALKQNPALYERTLMVMSLLTEIFFVK